MGVQCDIVDYIEYFSFVVIFANPEKFISLFVM